jgi:hypothetical protein
LLAPPQLVIDHRNIDWQAVGQALDDRDQTFAV